MKNKMQKPKINIKTIDNIIQVNIKCIHINKKEILKEEKCKRKGEKRK